MATAWSEIVTSDDDGKAKVIKVGDSVSASDFEDEEEFKELQARGIIRDEDYPEDIGTNESIRERNIRVVNERVAELEAQQFDPGTREELGLIDEEVGLEPAGGQEAADRSDKLSAPRSGSGSTASASSSKKASSS